ncbi:unnamed protein product [Withania somnifera]
MLRRSILRFSAVQSVKRIPIEVTTQVPSYLFSRREFSVSPKQNGPPLGPGSIGKPTETGSVLPRFIIGTVALSAGFFAAYQTGYLDKYHIKELHFTPELAREGIGIQDVKELKGSSEVSQDGETLGRPNADSKFVESDGLEQNESSGTRQDLSATEEPSRKGSESQIQVKDSSEITGEEANCTEVKESPPSSHQESMAPDEIRLSSTQSPEDTLDMKSSEVTTDAVQSEAIEVAPTLMQAETLQKENEASDMSPEPVSGRAKMEDAPHHDEKPLSLPDECFLRNVSRVTPTTSSDKHTVVEDLGDAYKSKDGKLVLDFLQALHEAEMRQAEIDARLFAEEKKYMKGRYEKELKDARARELMYAEREALLDKETEAELKLTKAQELCKAELDAAIAREKASQIEKMAEANLHINALCMAFYARSEEARQSRSVHKLAVFDTLKGTLRHFSLIPPGGGGILTHSLASVASWLKVRETGQSGDGIESLINRVESFLAQGKLSEAADALEKGLKDTQAAAVVVDWVKRARNRAITEQALTLLQSYATTISIT